MILNLFYSKERIIFISKMILSFDYYEWKYTQKYITTNSKIIVLILIYSPIVKSMGNKISVLSSNSSWDSLDSFCSLALGKGMNPHRLPFIIIKTYWQYRFPWLLPSFLVSVVFWPSARANMPLQSDSPEGSDTFQWPVIERDRVGVLSW